LTVIPKKKQTLVYKHLTASGPNWTNTAARKMNKNNKQKGHATRVQIKMQLSQAITFT